MMNVSAIISNMRVNLRPLYQTIALDVEKALHSSC